MKISADIELVNSMAFWFILHIHVDIIYTNNFSEISPLHYFFKSSNNYNNFKHYIFAL